MDSKLAWVSARLNALHSSFFGGWKQRGLWELTRVYGRFIELVLQERKVAAYSVSSYAYDLF